ncbi:MAG: hypothetical protein V2A73_11175 [Pseudomonadota bacterium]
MESDTAELEAAIALARTIRVALESALTGDQRTFSRLAVAGQLVPWLDTIESATASIREHLHHDRLDLAAEELADLRACVQDAIEPPHTRSTD